MRDQRQLSDNARLIRSFLAMFLAGFLLFLLATCARADGYGEPDLNEWYSSLLVPDSQYPSSCCGWADAYYADAADTDPATGALVAIITDTRSDVRTLPDGRTINRPHVPVGTRIIVPASKIRKVPIFNPTEHTIVFLASDLSVYCYEPVTGM